MNHPLLEHLEKIHTTELGAVRIQRNLALDTQDVVAWCKRRIQEADTMIRQGKNWYVSVDDVMITVNAHSFTIITAHKEKKGK